MSDTRAIPVIEGEVGRCGWCSIPLFRDGLPPIPLHGRQFHVVCVQAYARDVSSTITDVHPVVA